MIYEGLIEEGLECVKAIRHRYDGERRNPWNEFECGSNYVRSMASYSLLLALSGFEYDMVEGSIGFNPVWSREQFACFWSLNNGWGQFEHRDGALRLSVQYGHIRLNRFQSALLEDRNVRSVNVGGAPVAFTREYNYIRFDNVLTLSAGDELVVEAE